MADFLGKVTGAIIGKQLAPSQPAFGFFPRISTPSFDLEVGNQGRTKLTRTAFPQRFPDVLKKLSDLLGEVRPGFGRFTKAGVEAIRRAKGDALGTAREQLSRRRVQGSSFANAQLAQIEQASGRDEARFRAQAILQEIDQTFRIIDAEASIKLKNFEFELSELKVATGLALGMAGVISDQTLLDKRIAADAAVAAGEFGASVGESIFGGGDIFDFAGGGGDDLGSGSIGGDDLGSLAGKLFG